MGSSDEEATLSIPSLAFVAFLSFFIIRYFISSRSPESATGSRRAGQRFTGAQVEQVVQMFPQLNRRDIMWDLQRNGGSVAATTERVLGGRGLERVGSYIHMMQDISTQVVARHPIPFNQRFRSPQTLSPQLQQHPPFRKLPNQISLLVTISSLGSVSRERRRKNPPLPPVGGQIRKSGRSCYNGAETR